MASILVLVSSFDGQTRRIAGRLGDALARAGHFVTLLSADAPAARAAVEDHDALILGAAIRYGHYDRRLDNLVRERLRAIDGRPNAFFSVCLSAGGPGARPAVAQGYVDEFLRRTKWRPHETASFAGALLYTRYNPFIRFMMRLIVGFAGGETDTSRDYEYTDWQAVDRYAAAFASRLHSSSG